eukprot:SAG11_NODE_5228_length_1622_cov_3.065003_1_plen_210_part_00
MTSSASGLDGSGTSPDSIGPNGFPSIALTLVGLSCRLSHGLLILSHTIVKLRSSEAEGRCGLGLWWAPGHSVGWRRLDNRRGQYGSQDGERADNSKNCFFVYMLFALGATVTSATECPAHESGWNYNATVRRQLFGEVSNEVSDAEPLFSSAYPSVILISVITLFSSVGMFFCAAWNELGRMRMPMSVQVRLAQRDRDRRDDKFLNLML